ncbi:MAG TPA: hypothetical protein VN723_08750 [Rhizomicrobium sp.]|nr:hypothetical protein [Rhizomicrobium sp.]
MSPIPIHHRIAHIHQPLYFAKLGLEDAIGTARATIEDMRKPGQRIKRVCGRESGPGMFPQILVRLRIFRDITVGQPAKRGNRVIEIARIAVPRLGPLAGMRWLAKGEVPANEQNQGDDELLYARDIPVDFKRKNAWQKKRGTIGA